MKILVVLLWTALVLGSSVDAQNVKKLIAFNAFLKGNRDGGATLTYVEADKNYSIAIPARDLNALKQILTIMNKLSYAANYAKNLPVTISVDIKASGPIITFKAYPGYTTMEYSLSFDDYRSAMNVVKKLKALNVDLILRKMNMKTEA